VKSPLSSHCDGQLRPLRRRWRDPGPKSDKLELPLFVIVKPVENTPFQPRKNMCKSCEDLCFREYLLR